MYFQYNESEDDYGLWTQTYIYSLIISTVALDAFVRAHERCSIV